MTELLDLRKFSRPAGLFFVVNLVVGVGVSVVIGLVAFGKLAKKARS